MQLIEKFKKHRFLFEELVKRDFKSKYKGTVLGMLWSVLSPLLTLLVMKIVFTQFFGRTVEHYAIYLFSGNLMYSYFRESTVGGMSALKRNAPIFTKINVPKYMFVLSKSISSFVNFMLTLVVFFLFVAIDGIPFAWRFLLLLYPILTISLFNIGVSLILSAMQVFFHDTEYLYDIFTLILMYFSAIFYTIDGYSPTVQKLFYLNPLFCHITYFRSIVIGGVVPGPILHLLMATYALVALFVGGLIYYKNNHRFLYYV
ncbi:MAG: ABC transporter permease [Christensenellales bacterium]|jgi:ABC-2 type transport system permease protein